MSNPTVVIERGRDFGFRGTFTLDGAALNVSAWTFSGVVNREPGGPELFELTVDDSDAATGVILWTAADTVTDAIASTVKTAAVNLYADTGAGVYTYYRNTRVPVVYP